MRRLSAPTSPCSITSQPRAPNSRITAEPAVKDVEPSLARSRKQSRQNGRLGPRRRASTWLGLGLGLRFGFGFGFGFGSGLGLGLGLGLG